MDRRTVKYIILFAVLCEIVYIMPYCITNQTLTVSDIILYQSFSSFYPNKAMIMELSLQYAPFLIFQIIFARGISNRFLFSGVFFFSRCTHRIRWFLQQCMVLMGNILIFVLCLGLTGQMMAVFFSSAVWDKTAIILGIYYLLLFSTWVFFFSLLLNLLSIWKGDVFGLVIVALLQYLFIFLYILCEEINMSAIETRPVWLAGVIWGNPMSHLFIDWHSSVIKSVDGLIDTYQFGIDLNVSILIYVIADIVLAAGGARFIEKTDIFVND